MQESSPSGSSFDLIDALTNTPSDGDRSFTAGEDNVGNSNSGLFDRVEVDPDAGAVRDRDDMVLSVHTSAIEIQTPLIDPTTWQEACYGPDAEKWKLSMGAEISNFLKRGSWKIVPKEKARRAGKTIVRGKWVFKIKKEQDGNLRYKSCYVSKGFMQKPGIDYDVAFSPVISDMGIRMGIALLLWHSPKWTSRVIDIEAAFLEGPLGAGCFWNYLQAWRCWDSFLASRKNPIASNC